MIDRHLLKLRARDVGQVFPVALDANRIPNIYVGQTSADAWHPLTMQSGKRTDYILHNQPVDAEGVPYLSASHMRRLFFYDPDSSKQDYQPSTYESWNGYERSKPSSPKAGSSGRTRSRASRRGVPRTSSPSVALSSTRRQGSSASDCGM